MVEGSELTQMRTTAGALCFSLLVSIPAAGAFAQDWPQWGGPNRDFKADSKALADSWPAEGPRRLWSRELGEGHSSIVVQGNRLYTLYRVGPAGALEIRATHPDVFPVRRAGLSTAAAEAMAKGADPDAAVEAQAQANRDAAAVAAQTVDPAVAAALKAQKASLGAAAKPDTEVVVALDTNTGKTVWERRYDAPVVLSMTLEKGPGPHSTPLIAGDRLYTVGISGKFHCLDKKTGTVVWSHDLFQEFQGDRLARGYASSPLAYRDTVILPVGGPGTGVMSFRQKDGSVVWKSQDFKNAYSSPILINVDGQEQVVILMADTIAALDPQTGALLWSFPHKTQGGLNVSTPVWGEDNLLFLSSAYDGGSSVLHLTRAEGKTTVSEAWHTNKMRLHHGNAVRVGDYVYGSSGDFGPAFLSAVNVKTGVVAWQDRSFSKSSFVYADGKLILLDEDGQLALVTVSPEGLKVLSKVDLLQKISWTVPTLVGTRLYVRDRQTVMALDLK
jgi:outer membrane protein assembly factor BamB